MKKHLLIPATSILLFFSAPAFASANTKPLDGPKKSSQKQTTVKYEFSLFQIAYSLVKEKQDTTTKPIIKERKEDE
ncbi:hypothetical protein GYB57_03865 [bacterium]|nr:hypothetical protein [bacterium]|tara:strand:- start:276 stop:503 length:228 start_codon:yes stop_codon:yes gene_type:complete